jgi:hypothetical protein
MVPVLVSRIFTVIAAVLLVGAFGLLVLAPYDMPLTQGMSAIDPTLPDHLRRAILDTVGNGVWRWALAPVLARPIWLIPLSVGMLCVGVATTTNTPTAPHRTRHGS